jgi:hypothetical protein
MEQNINLLAALDVKQISILNGTLMLRLIIGYVFLLMFIYGIFFISSSYKRKTFYELEDTRKTLQTKIDDVNKELGLFDINILENIKNLPFNTSNFVGFYRYLEDLAIIVPKDVWLTSIIFSQPNDLITLKGKAISTPDIPVFIGALEQSKDFDNKKFGMLQLQKSSDSNNIEFTLGTIEVQANEPSKTK